MSSSVLLKDWAAYRSKLNGMDSLSAEFRQMLMDAYSDGWLDGHGFAHQDIATRLGQPAIDALMSGEAGVFLFEIYRGELSIGIRLDKPQSQKEE